MSTLVWVFLGVFLQFFGGLMPVVSWGIVTGMWVVAVISGTYLLGGKRDTCSVHELSGEEQDPERVTVPITSSEDVVETCILSHGKEEWEVLTADLPMGRITVRVLKVSDHMSTYLNVGDEYTLRKHERSSYDWWEIPSDQMKRDTSQVFLYFWPEGPSIEIDT